MPESLENIPTLDSIYKASRVSELKKRREQLANENAQPPAPATPGLGEKKPIPRLADLHREGKHA